MYDDVSLPQAIDPWEGNSQYAPTRGNWGRSPTALYAPSPSLLCSLHPNQQDQLGFLPLAEWQEGCEYEERPPRYIQLHGNLYLTARW